MRFSFIESLLRKTANKPAKLAEFYDRAGDIGYKDYNPQYWLQYAMASNAVKDYNAADRQFRTSFALAKRKGREYYTYQIDNHFAKFLLESRANVDLWRDYFAAFAEAHGLLIKQMRNVQHGYYPYRVARSYEEFFERRADTFSRSQLTDAKAMLDDVIRLADKAIATLRNNKLVREARAAAVSCLDIISDIQRRKRW